MDLSEYESWDDILLRVSASVSRDFPDVSKDDIYQQLWVVILEPSNKITLKMPGLVNILYKIANRFAWQQRKEHLSVTPQYAYRSSDLKKILEAVAFRNDWYHTFVPDDARSELGCDSLELSAEVAWGLQRLQDRHPEYYEAIYRRYILQIIPHNASAERKRLNRAIDALAEILNWYDRPDGEYVGNRRVITNATADYFIRKGWDD